MSTSSDRRPEWLRRKHGRQRSEPYRDLLAAAARCTATGDTGHQRAVTITTVHDLDGNELPITSPDEARNVVNALYRSRPRGDTGAFLISLPKPVTEQRPDGTWQVSCCVHDKAHGDAFITANPHRKVYDPSARTAAAAVRKPARRRTPAAARQREADQAAAAARAYEETLRTAPIGGAGTFDIRIWTLDEGHRQPATPAEQQRRDAVTAARLKAQKAARQNARATPADTGQQPLSRAAKAAASWWKSLG